MQLNLFNGGLSVRLAPHLIQQTESVICENIEFQYGDLQPKKDNTSLNITVSKSIYNFKNKWLSSSTNRTYVEFQEKLYYSDGVSKPQKSSDGTTWHNLGIIKPSSKPIVTLLTSPADLKGIYQYCYTYYNSLDGTESQPSPYSTELDIQEKAVSISVIASSDPQVNKIKIYRLGGNNTAMSLVVELSNVSATYTDTDADIDIIGTVLDSFDNAPAPIGLKYLTEANAMFFGALNDKLYFSDIAYVNYWSTFNFIDFDSAITGIGAVQNGLLVFTKYKTYIVVGNSPETVSKYLLSGSQGCVNHNSIQYARNTLIWLSTDGICMSTGGDIEVISKNNLGKLSLTPKCSALHDEVYYLSHTTGTLIVDLRFTLAFGNLTMSPDSLHVYNDTLYGSIQSMLYSIGTSTNNLPLHYKSPILSEGALSVIKNYKRIYVSSTGNLTFKVYINNVLVTTKDLSFGVEEIKLPQQQRLGYTIQFEVQGTGTLSELEYKIEGRQNGA